jgi:hypothetical protein
MSLARGNQISVGYAEQNLIGVHRDSQKYIAAEEVTFDPEIVQIDAKLFTPGQYHQTIERLQGTWNCSGSLKFCLHPTEGIEFLKGLLSDVNSTDLTGAIAYLHTLLGEDTLPGGNGFSIAIGEDLKIAFLTGVFFTEATIEAELDNSVMISLSFVAKKWDRDNGTAGTSTGQNAVSYVVTLVADTSDQIKLAIDGGTAVEVTIAAGAYTDAATLSAAINTAIEGTAGLLDSDKDPEVACYVNSADKVVFYSADKGVGAEITWTAGTNDANTLLGYGIPVETAGSATITTPSFSSIQPFITTGLTVKMDDSEICVEKFSTTINSGIIPRKCLGLKTMKAVKFDKKREVTWSIEKDYEDETAIDKWLANTNIEIKAELRTGTEISGGENYDLDIYEKTCRIDNTPLPVKKQGTLTQAISGVSFNTDTDYVDVRVDVKNNMDDLIMLVG